ncbi:hypothetical protein [uncultured Kordia sp.]|uniref:hypothetical protein n=1 Tax=uncultured Kordia sp. TaxID=507699 RepID=UPI0026134BD9|nr:hypothetical protein [uncultured Kordia sp.]
MKKQTIKNLTFKKNTISSFKIMEQLKGGNTSHTSCLCIDTVCECELEKTVG